MEKSALKTFASGAKSELERQIAQSLKLLGINSANDIKTATLQGDITIIEGNPNSFEKDVFGKRKQIIDLIKREGFDHTIEELSYTWFNRLIALRFMEVHDYLPHGFRVLSSKSNGFEPDIIKNLQLVAKELALDLLYCQSLKEKERIEELYRYVLFQQCKALASILPMLFSAEFDYLELLLPKTLLKGETIITKLVAIPESYFLDDVEVIGWLYQYYISAKKDEIYASKKTITKDEIAAVTQLFTPEWIVRYLTENSLGRLWTEARPTSSLKQSMKYFIDDAPQEPGVQKQLELNIYRVSNPTKITVLDPCCGSGHILVYAFDLLKDMYLESGYSLRDIPRLILQNNLIGFDIDKRASQLASFALSMKALKYDPKFFAKERICEPKIYEIISSKSIPTNFFSEIKSLSLVNNLNFAVLEYVRDTFRDAKELGSLTIVEKKDYQSTINQLEVAMSPVNLENKFTIFSDDAIYSKIPVMIRLLKQATIMSTKVDVMITNPPYLPISDMEKKVKDYAKKHYPSSKADMFAMFIEKSFNDVKSNGFSSLVTMQSWMFLSSYEKFRKSIINHKQLISMCHMGNMVMGIAFGTNATIWKNSLDLGYSGSYYKVTTKDMINDIPQVFTLMQTCTSRFTAKTSDFQSIPGSPIAYWVSKRERDLFTVNRSLQDYGITRLGMTTGSNDRFLRLWFEVNSTSISFNIKSLEDSIRLTTNWVPYNKGGTFRKWYGNEEYIVLWKNNGEAIKKFATSEGRIRSTVPNTEYYFLKCISWSKVSSGKIAFRRKNHSIFDVAGACYFSDDKYFNYLHGLLNSVVIEHLLKIISPTLNFEGGQIASLPVILCDETVTRVSDLVERNIAISITDWDSYEVSREFKKHPLMMKFSEELISSAYERWEIFSGNQFTKLKQNEEFINQIFIEIYNLQDELSPKVEEKYITLRKADLKRDIKSLISYFVGIIMGRYSLTQEGLIFAGGIFDDYKYGLYQPVENGIVPLFNMDGIKNDLTNKVMDLVMIVYGNDYFKENLNFIAEALGRRSSESAYETIQRYLINDFYFDHLKFYQKRPIYWMFNSGKNNAFQALVYLHRYDENTLANINSKHFLFHSYRIKSELESLDIRIKHSTGSEQVKLERLKKTYTAQKAEMEEYGEVLAHKALEYIQLDLDDGVKVNYEKFQNVGIATNSGPKVTKDLLVPIK